MFRVFFRFLVFFCLKYFVFISSSFVRGPFLEQKVEYFLQGKPVRALLVEV